ncbi:thiamine biosynthesis protein ApbE [Rhodoblastus sphagnicola]|uniref:FAD:protein FMN transferase n=1 Tax=Rhodoblastus sphagnicola TaxID=333368 RepID=A0A2S6NDQ7_9HYPH|nr:FAD:protein FMN transferase [Rhodoblastus sphagnicola]PPQ32762.1 thiamine biosynthesis protein ApbE [Rhodoblastus sphagnicola]
MSTDALQRDGLHRRALNGPAMGARWSAVFYADDAFDTSALAVGLQQAVDEVERQMSVWRPDSDLERLNRAPTGVWVDVPRKLMRVLQEALLVGELSDGAFDIGVGDLVKAWGLGAGSRTPDAVGIASLSGRRRSPPPQNLRLDPASSRAKKLAPLRLDLSGIAKGFGVDELDAIMKAAGLSSWLVGIDGEMRAAGGKPDGKPWAVGHERPSREARALMGVIELDDGAVATSGDYRHVQDIDGRGHAHTIDPRRAAPLANDLASVTVLAPTAMVADAWATALMVLGEDAGSVLSRRLGLRAIFVTRNGETHAVFD